MKFKMKFMFGKNKLNISDKCYKYIQEFLSEFVGTMVLVTIGCSGIAQTMLSNDKNIESNKILYIGFGWGLGVFAGLVISIRITGHLNPAISLAMFMLRKIKFLQLIIFNLGQYLGAFCGAIIVYMVYLTPIRIHNHSQGDDDEDVLKETAKIFATYPPDNIHPISAFVDQTIATGLLALCILAITDKRLNKNANQLFYPLYIGLLVTLLIYAFGLNCGAPLNPARDFAPRVFTAMAGWGRHVFSSNLGAKHTWFLVPIFATHIGAIIGALVYTLLIGIHLEEVKQVSPQKVEDVEAKEPLYVEYASSPYFKPKHQAKLAYGESDIENECIQDYTDKIDENQRTL